MLIFSHLSWGLRLSLSPAGAAISPRGQGSILSLVPAAVPSLMMSSACLSPQLTLLCRLIRLHTLRNAAAKGMLQSHRLRDAQGDLCVCLCVCVHLPTAALAPAHIHVLAHAHKCAWTRTRCCPRVFQQHPHPPRAAPPLFPLKAATEGNGNFCRESAWSCCLWTGALPGSTPAMPTPSPGAGSGGLGAGCRPGRLLPPLQPEDVRAERPRLAHRPCPRALGLRPGGQQVTERELRPGTG